MKQWYYAKDGEQKGPVMEDVLIALLQNNEIPPDSLIWSEGMSEWASAQDIGLVYAPPAEGFHTKENTPPENLTTPSIPKEFHPAESAAQDEPDTSAPEEDKAEHGGVGRGAYFGLTILLLIISGMLGASGALGEYGSLLLVIPGLILGGMRYRNIGYSPWVILLAFIPLVNLIVGYQCLALPPGYAQTKQSDTAMKVVSGIYILFIVMILLAIIIPLMSGY
jgi:uncharacterized membrane protein YhaH (DUF805 family)